MCINKSSRLHLSALFTLFVCIGFPLAATAQPPAVTNTCEGIKAAYPVLGAQCTKAYKRVNHNPTSEDERYSAYRARKSVLEIFRKAYLCNGYYDASRSSQDRFKSGEDGHIQQLNQLIASMVNAGDQHQPPNFSRRDLSGVSIKKKQCK